MPNQYNNPIMGSININTQPYYGALAKAEIAKDHLANTIASNPFDVQGIDVDRANLQNTLNPYNQQLQDLVKSPSALDNPRSFSNKLMELHSGFKQAKETGSLSPFIQRKKDYTNQLAYYDELAKDPKKREAALAQKQMFINQQKAFESGDPSLNYLTGSQGERADYHDFRDPLSDAVNVGKMVKADKDAYKPTAKELEGNRFYDVIINGSKEYISPSKLAATLENSYKTNADSYLRMQQADPNRRIGVDEQGNMRGEGPQYAFALDGTPNTNTEIGAAAQSMITGLSYSKESIHGSPIQSEFNYAVKAAARQAKTTKDKIAEDNKLKLYETQEKIKPQDEGFDNWSKANEGISAIKNKQKEGTQLTSEENKKLSQYIRASQLKKLYTEEFYKKHPEVLKLQSDLGKALYTTFKDKNVSFETIDKYTKEMQHDGVTKTNANVTLAEDVLTDLYSDKISPEGLEKIKKGFREQLNKFGGSIFDGSNSLNHSKVKLLLQNISRDKNLSKQDKTALFGKELYDQGVKFNSIGEFSDIVETIIDRESGLWFVDDGIGDKAINVSNKLNTFEKLFDEGLNTELQKDLFSQGYKITPESKGDEIWQDVSKNIVPEFKGTKMREYLGKQIYKVNSSKPGKSGMVEVSDDIIKEFKNAESISIPGLIDYDFRAPQAEFMVTDKDGNTNSYIVNIPPKLAPKFEQFYTQSSKTPTQKKVGIRGSESRVNDMRSDFKYDHIRPNFRQDNNIIKDVIRGGERFRDGIFGNVDGKDIDKLNMYQEHLDKNTIGIKVKAGSKGRESVLGLNDVLQYYGRALNNFPGNDSKKIAAVYNIIANHLKTNIKSGNKEILTELENIARSGTGDFNDFLQKASSLIGLEKTEGFAFPNKQVALGLLTVSPRNLGPVKGQSPGK